MKQMEGKLIKRRPFFAAIATTLALFTGTDYEIVEETDYADIELPEGLSMPDEVDDFSNPTEEVDNRFAICRTMRIVPIDRENKEILTDENSVLSHSVKIAVAPTIELNDDYLDKADLIDERNLEIIVRSLTTSFPEIPNLQSIVKRFFSVATDKRGSLPVESVREIILNFYPGNLRDVEKSVNKTYEKIKQHKKS